VGGGTRHSVHTGFESDNSGKSLAGNQWGGHGSGKEKVIRTRKRLLASGLCAKPKRWGKGGGQKNGSRNKAPALPRSSRKLVQTLKTCTREQGQEREKVPRAVEETGVGV